MMTILLYGNTYQQGIMTLYFWSEIKTSHVPSNVMYLFLQHSDHVFF